ncbi:MAG: hypothetical protein AB7P37_03305 [Ramlibacter sp.]
MLPDRIGTQTEFAELEGISQPAVSDLQKRGIYKPDRTIKGNHLAYVEHLREQAAGRGADGELAANRAALAATTNERAQLKLKRERGQFAEVALMERVLAFIGAQIASKLEPLPARIKMLMPELPAEDIKRIESEITEARNIAAGASLAALQEEAALEDDDATGGEGAGL